MFEYLAYIAAILSIVVAIINYISLLKYKANIERRYLDFLNSFSTYLGLQKEISGKDFAHAQKSIIELLSSATSFLEETSGKKVYGSIRLVEVDENNNLNLITFARDIKSKSKREVFKYKYPIEKNIAYKSILEQSPDNAYFLTNDIKNLSEAGIYNTTKNDWDLIYKSALIVPVKESKRNTLLGFLSFDSPDKGVFTEEMIEFAMNIGNAIGKALKGSIKNDSNNLQPLEHG